MNETQIKETVARVLELDERGIPGPYFISESFGDVSVMADDPGGDPWTVCHMTDPLGYDGATQRMHNGVLFAYYRTAAPALAREVERLREDNAVLQSQVDNADVNLEQVRLTQKGLWRTKVESAESRIGELERTVERLTAVAREALEAANEHGIQYAKHGGWTQELWECHQQITHAALTQLNALNLPPAQPPTL